MQPVRGVTLVSLWRGVSTSCDPGPGLGWAANQAPVQTDNGRLTRAIEASAQLTITLDQQHPKCDPICSMLLTSLMTVQLPTLRHMRFLLARTFTLV